MKAEKTITGLKIAIIMAKKNAHFNFVIKRLSN